MHNCSSFVNFYHLPKGGDVYFINLLLFISYKTRWKVVERRCREVDVQSLLGKVLCLSNPHCQWDLSDAGVAAIRSVKFDIKKFST